jgi:4-amino-4-deoxy-L-arabinose transferase-like glycosyltransferase
MNGSNALQALETGQFRVFYPENNGREGLYINAVALSVGVFGNQAWAVRLPSALFGILTVWGLYCLGAEIFSRSIGLLAAFYVATSYWHIDFSRISVRAISAPCFLVWALYVFFAAIRRARTQQSSLMLMALAGGVFGLGFHTYIAYRVTPLLIAILAGYYFWHSRRENWLRTYGKGLVLFTIAASIAVLPLAIYFLQHPADFSRRATEVSVASSAHPVQELVINAGKTLLMFFWRGDTNWRHNYPPQPEVFWPVAIFLLIGTGITISNMRSPKHAEAIPYFFSLGWLMLALVPAVFSDEGVPHALRSILAIPAVFLVAAAGAHWTYQKLSLHIARVWRVGVAVLFLLAVCYEPYHVYFGEWALDPNVQHAFSTNQLQIAGQINSLPRNVPKYVVVPFPGELENGTPMLAQTVVFLTGSYTLRKRQESNIQYVVPEVPLPVSPVEWERFCQEIRQSHPQAPAYCVLPE